MGTGIEANHVEDRESQLNVAVDDVQKEDGRRAEDPEWVMAQRRYLRKLDFIILPMISLLYFFEYLDRANIGVSASLCGYDQVETHHR